MSLLKPELPPGLLYFPGWLSEAEHEAALQEIDGHKFELGLSRRVQHYGARYHYDSSQVAEIGSAPPIPKFLASICERLYKECDFERMPEQVIVNEYINDQGIAAHVDRNSFGPKVATISLIESWHMKFRNLGGIEIIDVLLEKNSLAIMTNESRTNWSHEIKKLKMDKIAGLKRSRGRRLSITFRTINPPRYWKWVVDGTTERIYRLKNGKFEKYAQNRWRISDIDERAVQDPEFVEISEPEANELIG